MPALDALKFAFMSLQTSWPLFIVGILVYIPLMFIDDIHSKFIMPYILEFTQKIGLPISQSLVNLIFHGIFRRYVEVVIIYNALRLYENLRVKNVSIFPPLRAFVKYCIVYYILLVGLVVPPVVALFLIRILAYLNIYYLNFFLIACLVPVVLAWVVFWGAKYALALISSVSKSNTIIQSFKNSARATSGIKSQLFLYWLMAIAIILSFMVIIFKANFSVYLFVFLGGLTRLVCLLMMVYLYRNLLEQQSKLDL